MEFGLEIGGYWPSNGHHINNLIPEMIKVVKVADKIGLDAVVVGEHHFMDYGATPSPVAVVCNLAPMITIPRLVTAILMLPMHNAPIMAGEIALADHLTGGRLEIGPARGGGPYEYARVCMPSDDASTRKNFEEQFKALRMLLTEENVSFQGEFTKFEGVTIMPPTLQKPYPPIWQTCQRNEAAYHCGKNGYHVFTSSLRRPMSYVRELAEAFRRGVAESSKPQGEPRFAHLQWVYVAKDDADAREKLEIAYLKQQKFWGIWQNSASAIGGVVRPVEIEDTLESLAKGLIIGTKDYVEDRLLEIKELGTDLMAMKTGFGATNADEIASLERLAEHILPKMQTKAQRFVPQTA